MGTYLTTVNAYIEKAEPFAQPILTELRERVHVFCPEVNETIKWGFPNFEYKGSILCSMASFKRHCSFTFWQGSLLTDTYGILEKGDRAGMGHLGKMTSLTDLPSADQLGELLLQAVALIDQGVKLKKTVTKKNEPLVIPEVLQQALDENPAAKAVFDNFSYSHKREYVDWLNEAKTAATLHKRLDTTLSNLSEGKSKEWKYRK